MFSYL
jgi:hypothetical protein